MLKKFINAGEYYAVGRPNGRMVDYNYNQKAYVITKKGKVNEKWDKSFDVASDIGGSSIFIAVLTSDGNWVPRVAKSNIFVCPWDAYEPSFKAWKEKEEAYRAEQQAKQNARKARIEKLRILLRDRANYHLNANYYYYSDKVEIPIDKMIEILENTLSLTGK
jgi:hypothetical protein